MDAYEDEERSAFQKYRVILGCGLVAVVAVLVWFGQKHSTRASRPRQEQNVILVNLPPPPPVPPAPRPPPQSAPPPAESQQKMIEQAPINETEPKPVEPPKTEAPASDAPALGTSIQGNGQSDGFGLSGGDSFGGGTGGKGNTVSRGSSSRWGWYAGHVQSAISQALQSNANTRTANFRVDVQIWSDRTGRITRVHLVRSTGDAALDGAITNDVLAGLILQEPPPDGMPMPIVLRLTARNSSIALSRQHS
jgi:outer membrane biosynthesis protein TonB